MIQIVNKKLSDVRPCPSNPRVIGEDAITAVANSIKEFGFKVPIVIDGAGEIVCGHTRYLAAQRLGLATAPCVTADDLNEDQVKAFRLADNKTASLSGWNIDKLSEELAEIEKVDMSEFGFIRAETELVSREKEYANEEMDVGDYDDEAFEHECEFCGFRWNE